MTRTSDVRAVEITAWIHLGCRIAVPSGLPGGFFAWYYFLVQELLLLCLLDVWCISSAESVSESRIQETEYSTSTSTGTSTTTCQWLTAAFRTHFSFPTTSAVHANPTLNAEFGASWACQWLNKQINEGM
jgi:hypothetical protein